MTDQNRVDGEELKRASEILEPDERQHLFRVFEQTSGFSRPLTVGDLHSLAESLVLHDGVPEEVRSHFAAVKNLIVYSWFYYPFNATAQFLSYVTVEFALRKRLGAKPEKGFKSLLRRAVRDKLISDGGFSHVKPRAEESIRIAHELGLPPPEIGSYVETLIDVLPLLRNQLAHGAHIVHPNGGTHARIAMEFINQLFARPVTRET
jgi:hypothetical protein